MNPLWKNAARTWSSLVVALAMLLATVSVRADQPSFAEKASTACVWPIVIPTVDFDDCTLEVLVESFRVYAGTRHDRDEERINIVLDTRRLSAAQLGARITLHERNMTAEEVLYAVCKGLGIGYRVDAHAVVISSRSHVGLPDPPSKRVENVPDGRITGYVVIVGRDKS